MALASLSVAGQWVFFLFGRRMFELQFPDLAGNPDLVDELADHIAAFSIAAIARTSLAARGRARAKRKPPRVPARRCGRGRILRESRPDRAAQSKDRSQRQLNSHHDAGSAGAGRLVGDEYNNYMKTNDKNDSRASAAEPCESGAPAFLADDRFPTC